MNDHLADQEGVLLKLLEALFREFGRRIDYVYYSTFFMNEGGNCPCLIVGPTVSTDGPLCNDALMARVMGPSITINYLTTTDRCWDYNETRWRVGDVIAKTESQELATGLALSSLRRMVVNTTLVRQAA